MLYLIFNISNNITQCAAWTRPCCSPAPRTRRSCSTTSASGARTSSPGQLSLVGRHRDTVMLISHWSGSPPGSCGTSPRPAASPWSPSSRGRRTRTPGTVRCTMLYCTVLYCTVLYCGHQGRVRVRGLPRAARLAQPPALGDRGEDPAHAGELGLAWGSSRRASGV